MLREQALGYFEELASHNHGTTNAYLKHITYGLLRYFYRIISRTKKKRAMRHAMRKPQNMTIKHFYARHKSTRGRLYLDRTSPRTLPMKRSARLFFIQFPTDEQRNPI